MQCIPNIQTRKYSSPETLNECGPEVSYIQFSIHQKHLILYHRVVILVLWITFPTFFSRQSIGNVQDDRGVRQEWILARPLYWYQPRTQALPLVLSSLGDIHSFRKQNMFVIFLKIQIDKKWGPEPGKRPPNAWGRPQRLWCAWKGPKMGVKLKVRPHVIIYISKYTKFHSHGMKPALANVTDVSSFQVVLESSY